MKSEKLIITLLVALLAVNSVGMVMTVMEEKEQTQIALKTAELTAIQAKTLTYLTIDEDSLTEIEYKALITYEDAINKIGKELNEDLYKSLFPD